MQHLILGLLIAISTPVQAQNLAIGLEYGQGFFPKKEFQSESKNQLIELRIQSQYKFLHYGLGYQRQELGYNFSKGQLLSSEIISNNLYLYLSPRYNLSNNWDLSFNNKIMINDSIATGMESNQKIFSGLGLGFKDSYEKLNYRLGFNISQGMDFSHSATLAMVSLELSFKKDTPQQIVKPSVLIKNKILVISNFGYKEDFLKDTSKLEILKTLISKSSINYIKIIGHTDKFGGDSYNLKLGLKRAEFVNNFLEVDGELKSYGLKESIFEDDDLNRRVEIIFKLDVLNPENQSLLDFIKKESL